MTIKIIIRDTHQDIIEVRPHVFNKKNINKIAYDYDATILTVDFESGHAVFKDHLDRLVFADNR